MISPRPKTSRERINRIYLFSYTQVASLSVMTYFLFSLFGSQFLRPDEAAVDANIFQHIKVSLIFIPLV